jgi:hypothetical protein
MTQGEREARKAFRQVDAEKAITEYEIAKKVFSANRERLKAGARGGRDAGRNEESRAQEEGLIAPRRPDQNVSRWADNRQASLTELRPAGRTGLKAK